MRPQNTIARDRLDGFLRMYAPCSASMIAEGLKISVPTVHRMLRERGADVIRMGTTKSARYALRGQLRGVPGALSVYLIDEGGRGHACGEIHLADPSGSVLDVAAMGWPVDTIHRAGWWDGLPYPIYDMRPQGFIGRSFAHRTYTDLNISQNPEEWSDQDIMYVLSRRCPDTVGNLIVGDQSYQYWQHTISNPPEVRTESTLVDHYAELADQAAGLGVVGSSAAGEFPKFTALRVGQGATTPHVIVKFSGADNSAAVTRWADLLVCEHIALTVLQYSSHITPAPSRILAGRGRTFLEVERFDRIGDLGRRPVVSLSSLDAAFIGSGSGLWPAIMEKLHKISPAWIKEGTTKDINILWWYGRLIANTDMHLGNLSFCFNPAPNKEPVLSLSPVYDMLPMMYAPLPGGEVPVREFNPPLPLPRDEIAWLAAHSLACKFWQLSGNDGRISVAFRDICNSNLNKLLVLSERFQGTRAM